MAITEKPEEVHQEAEANAPEVTDLDKHVVVDTVHTDEAMKVLANYNGDQAWDEIEEKRLRRKIDRRLLPIMCITYALQYYDKAMISQASIFGLRTDLHLTGNRYSMASSIFFLGFVAGAYPAAQIAQRYPIERVAAGLVFLWGVCFILTSACFTWQALYTQRFFLGFLEAGISPIFMLMVGQFYKKDEQAFMMGVWYSCSGFVGVLSPLINYGLGHITGSLAPWRYMFIVGGIMTILWTAVVYFYMPPDPIRAKGFTERERYIAVARLRTNNSGVRNTHFKVQQAVELFLDPKFWIMFSMAFLSMIAAGPVNAFLPIIVAGLGFNTLNTLLLTMPVGAVAGLMILAATWTAYKVPRVRAWIILASELVTIMSSVLLWRLPRSSTGPLLFAVYTLAGFTAGWGIILGLSIANTAGYTKRTVISSVMYIGYCLGQFVGPLLFKPQDAPTFGPGFKAVLITASATAGLAVLYRYLCKWENNKRDKAGTLEAFEHAYEDDVTDRKNPQFRYVY